MPTSASVACKVCRRFGVRYGELCREGIDDAKLFLISRAELHLRELKAVSEQNMVLAQNWIEHARREHSLPHK
jgi:hypothetical protein